MYTSDVGLCWRAVDEAGFRRSEPNSARLGDLTASVEQVDRAHGRICAITFVSRAEDGREELIVSALEVARRFRREDVLVTFGGDALGDVPYSQVQDATISTPREVPPLGSPPWLWSAEPWIRRAWATPTRRAALACGWVATAGLTLLVAGGPVLTALSLLVMFFPVLWSALVDIATGKNRFPHGYREPSFVAVWLVSAAGTAIALWLLFTS